VTRASVNDAAARSADKLISAEKSAGEAELLRLASAGIGQVFQKALADGSKPAAEPEPGQYLIVDVTEEDGDGLTDARISAAGPDGRVRRPALDDEARS
jgi:hypothetical protein